MSFYNKVDYIYYLQSYLELETNNNINNWITDLLNCVALKIFSKNANTFNYKKQKAVLSKKKTEMNM